MLGNELILVCAKGCLKLLFILVFIKDFHKLVEAYALVYTALGFCVEGYIIFNVHRVVGDDLKLALTFLGFHIDVGFLNALFVELIGKYAGNGNAGLGKQLSGKGIGHRAGQCTAKHALDNAKLFIVFETADSRKIVSLRVEEKVVDVGGGAVDRERLAGAELFINLQQGFLTVLGDVLLDGGKKSLAFAEILLDLLVLAYSQGADEGGQGKLAVFIYADIDYLVLIGLIFKPCAADGDNCRAEELAAGFINDHIEICAGRTDQL